MSISIHGETVADFAKGDTVEYTGAARPALIGRRAVVVRSVKSRNVVTIKWIDDGKWYDALPTNLTIMVR